MDAGEIRINFAMVNEGYVMLIMNGHMLNYKYLERTSGTEI